MVAPSRRSMKAPKAASTNNIYMYLLFVIFAIGGLIYIIHPGNSEVEEALASSSTREQESQNTKKKHSAHLRRQPSSDIEKIEKIETEGEVNPADQAESLLPKEKSTFEKVMEKKDLDMEHLDRTIFGIKDDINMKERTILNEMMKGKLEKEMKQSEERLKAVMDKYLEGKDQDEKTIHDIEDKMVVNLEERLKNDIFQAAEEVTMSKSNDIDQVVLEDVVNGMSNKEIEEDVKELEKNLLVDLDDEMEEAEIQIEKKINETLHKIEKEVIKEELNIDVDNAELEAAEEEAGSEAGTKNEVKEEGGELDVGDDVNEKEEVVKGNIEADKAEEEKVKEEDDEGGEDLGQQ